ncbi:kallikrein-7-like isoform X2 [Astyanax mexicanus]|uniref:Kallikrein-7-like isoform X2 n=1 Tax=Astyanax mexicanus TaxID=7994 RepID=A0A8T2LD75_ASTMX|nr:kallikrein-7-like isoform X2 [Astyanax mexicanus]
MNALHRVLLAAALSILAYDVTFGIINGKKADENDLKFVVSVQNASKHKCGGLLIDRKFVLTAAHCSGDMSVVIGTHNIGNTYGHRYKIVFFHKKQFKLFKKVDRRYYEKTQIAWQFLEVPENSRCRVAGWGETETNKNPVSNLMVTDVSVVNSATCKKSWGEMGTKLPSGVICAGGSEKSGVCEGDSGGPLLCGDVVVGIVSFNFDKNCHYPNAPNVYTNIGFYRHWIISVVGKFSFFKDF